jgi:hypothetical protein
MIIPFSARNIMTLILLAGLIGATRMRVQWSASCTLSVSH